MNVITFKFHNIAEILAAVEEAFKNGDATLNRREKAVELINEAIDIIYLPEWVEEKIIGLLVDYSIAAFNWAWGHDWLGKVKEIIANRKD